MTDLYKPGQIICVNVVFQDRVLKIPCTVVRTNAGYDENGQWFAYYEYNLAPGKTLFTPESQVNRFVGEECSHEIDKMTLAQKAKHFYNYDYEREIK